MNLLLRAKHWQLFLATFGIPFLFQMVFMFNFITHGFANAQMFNNYFWFFPLIMMLFASTLFCWMWSVATGLQKAVPPQIKMKVTKFKIFFFIPIVYFFLFFGVFFSSFNNNFLDGGESSSGFPLFLLIIFPLHFFCMFCMLYNLYFVAKTLKTAEMQRGVSFSEFAGDFFLVWFYPIGVWILQPRINAIVEQYDAMQLQAENIKEVE